MKITDDFSYFEFSCKCGKCSFKDGYQIDKGLVVSLQRIRDYVGEAMIVSSGLRCFDHNKAENGAENSFHLLGRAADIRCSDSVKRRNIVHRALDIGLTCGLSKGFVHLDNRKKAKIFLY